MKNRNNNKLPMPWWAIGMVLLLTVPTAGAQDWVYTVRPGDTLWDLSAKYLKRGIAYTERVRQLNTVADPYRLRPGSQIRFPIRWLKVQPASVAVETVSGNVRFVSGGSAADAPLSAGATLDTGDRLIVGDMAAAVLRFADGSKLIVRANSEIMFDTLTAYGDTGMVDTRARLQRGRVDAQTAPARGPGSRYEIHTPAAVSAVRGTEYRVSAEADGSIARTEVLSGTVAVTGSGRTQRVPKKFGVVAQAGKPPERPRELLAAPDVSGLPAVVERDPVNLTWPGSVDAEAYRIQVAKADSFESLVVDTVSASPSTGGFTLAEDGEYYLRVRGVDVVGLEGLDSNHQFTLNARPEPPFPVQPSPAARIHEPQARYQWTVPASAVAYRFQLSRDNRFQDVIEDRELPADASYQSSESLDPGTYFWRLATKDAEGETGPYSDPQEFTYRPLPPSPESQPPSVGEDELTFRWAVGAPGQTYQFQLATDRDFNNLVVDTRLDTSEYRLPTPDAGTFYMRVAAVDPDGTVGTFGDAQRFEVPWK
ncbi:MAG: FecR domain-containing protein, partial [Gammaproteobacteria bacterium]|nr:FecR domain-containing protein [Gammaproteobacteria bacterium]